MSKTLKIVLLVMAALSVTCFGGMYYLWQKYGADMMEEGAVAYTAGEAVGPTTDNAGCLAMAASRFPLDSGMTTAMQQGVFLQSCLPKSTPTPGFCDGVPDGNDRKATQEWIAGRCPGMEATDPRCPLVASTVQAYCRGRPS